MNKQIAVGDFFQRRAECGNQIWWQIANEPNRVVDNYFLIVRHPQPPRSRIERSEHAFFRQHVTGRKHVKQGGLAGVGIANDRNYWKLLTQPLLASLLATNALGFDLSLQTVDAITHAPPIGCQFCFARPASAAAPRLTVTS